MFLRSGYLLFLYCCLVFIPCFLAVAFEFATVGNGAGVKKCAMTTCGMIMIWLSLKSEIENCMMIWFPKKHLKRFRRSKATTAFETLLVEKKSRNTASIMSWSRPSGSPFSLSQPVTVWSSPSILLHPLVTAHTFLFFFTSWATYKVEALTFSKWDTLDNFASLASEWSS